MCDYRSIEIYKDDERVSRLQIVGLAAEHFWKLAFNQRRGLNSLAWHDLGGKVCLYNATVNGRRRSELLVQVPQGDAECALKNAAAVADFLLERGFFLLDAVVRQRSKAGHIVGDRDLVGERRSAGDGRSSIEVKFKRILTDAVREKARADMRTDALAVWHAALEMNSSFKWSERVNVLVEFGTAADIAFKAIRIDVLGRGSTDWNGLCGWPGRPAAVVVGAGSGGAQRGGGGAAIMFGNGRRSGSVLASSTKRPLQAILEDKALPWETISGVRMGSVTKFLELTNTPAAKRARPTIGEKLPTWKKRFNWPQNTYNRSNSLGSPGGGGKKQVMASKRALGDIYSVI